MCVSRLRRAAGLMTNFVPPYKPRVGIVPRFPIGATAIGAGIEILRRCSGCKCVFEQIRSSPIEFDCLYIVTIPSQFIILEGQVVEVLFETKIREAVK
jgi:hypothetical protein